MSTGAIPPLPAGYTLDASSTPPLPAGYKLDAPVNQQTPEGTISNAPTGPKAWLESLENDIRTGSGSTLPGRVLHALGAPGTNVGQPPAVADTVASPILGPVHMAQGAADIPEHPWQGTKKVISGALQTATLPGSFVAPEASEAAQSLMGKSKALIPSVQRAGQNFQEVMGAAKDAPVSLDKASEGVLRLMDWQRKTQLGPTINKFLNRVTDPKQGQLTYGEARDFYQLLGRMSSDESSKLAPAIRFDLTHTVAGLKQDIGAAAESVGKGEQYAGAMKDYAQAKRLEEWIQAGKEFGIDVLKYGVGPGIAGLTIRKGIDAATNQGK